MPCGHHCDVKCVVRVRADEREVGNFYCAGEAGGRTTGLTLASVLLVFSCQHFLTALPGCIRNLHRISASEAAVLANPGSQWPGAGQAAIRS